MTALPVAPVSAPAAPSEPGVPTKAPPRARWIERWDPDDESFWAGGGETIARRNLLWSMFAEHIGFSVWVLWTIVVLNLANIGVNLSVSELFLLTLVPNLVGSVLRIPYTFAVPRFGGRAWTTVSAALLFIPTALLAFLVPSGWLLHQTHGTQLWVLLLCAASAGVGGGNFSSSMANISFFYPERKKGWTQAKADTRSYVASLRYTQTWVMSLLYIGTFGSFIGFSFALPLVIKTTFPEFLTGHPFIANYLAGLGFVGALIGSLSRPVGGWLSDRIGGARVTLAVFVGMTAFTAAAIDGVHRRSFAVFFASYMVIFLLAGIGNGSTYKMIPAIFALLGRREAFETGVDVKEAAVEFKRRAAAVIGIAGAIGAFGGVLIQVVLRQASLHVSNLVKVAKTPAAKVAVAAAHSDWSVPALWVFLGSYVVLAGVTWAVYLRPRNAMVRSAAVADVALADVSV